MASRETSRLSIGQASPEGPTWLIIWPTLHWSDKSSSSRAEQRLIIKFLATDASLRATAQAAKWSALLRASSRLRWLRFRPFCNCDLSYSERPIDKTHTLADGTDKKNQIFHPEIRGNASSARKLRSPDCQQSSHSGGGFRKGFVRAASGLARGGHRIG